MAHLSAATALLLSAAATVAAATAAGEPIIYPKDAGILDVRTFGAVGDGKADDTAAIQKALSAGVDNHQIVYLPAGTFKVSDTLRWKHNNDDGPSHGWGRFLQLRGAGEKRTRIIVATATAGFTDAAKPKAVVQTGSSGSHGNKQYWNGEGNEAFANQLRDLSIEIASGNPGAIAVSFQASNSGAMRNITLTAAKDSGSTGIDLTRRDNGPGMLSSITIEGFAVGVRTGQEICQFSGEFLTLRNQREVGILGRDAVLALRKVTSEGQAPMLRVSGVGLCSLLESTATGTAAKGAAIEIRDDGRAVVGSLTVSGFESAIALRGKAVPGLKQAWWTSDPAVGPAAATTYKPITALDTPLPPLPPSSQWALVDEPSGGDDGPALAAAFASTKPVVCFRRADYRFGDTITVPGHVRWLIGLGTGLGTLGEFPDNAPLLRLAGGAKSDTTVIDNFTFGAKDSCTLVRHEDARTAVIRDFLKFGGRAICDNTVGAGPLFVEDCAGNGYSFARGTSVYIRQWNAEGGGEPKAVIDGAQVWALGLKCESAETVLSASSGSRIEIHGGLLYTFGSDQRAAFKLTDCSAFLSFAGTTYMNDGFFKLLVQNQTGDKTDNLMRDAVPGRGGGRFVPAYLSAAP